MIGKRNGRELITFEKTLGLYSVAGAICSHGDAIDFVDGEKQAIIVADTCGKRKDYGDKTREFLRTEIESGWGSSKDIKTEIIDLGKRLLIAGTGEPIFSDFRLKKLNYEDENAEEWWYAIEFCITSLDDDKVSVSGLQNLIYKEGGIKRLYKFEDFDSFKLISPYHFEEPENRGTIDFSLNDNDVLIVTSDGLEWNMRVPYRTLEDLRKYHHQPMKDIEKIINENVHLSANKIRDALVSELSDYITGEYFVDDVTFAVVKKT